MIKVTNFDNSDSILYSNKEVEIQMRSLCHLSPFKRLICILKRKTLFVLLNF